MLLDVARLVSYQRAFTVTTGLETVGSQDETPMLLLKNPSGSGTKLLITHFLFGTNASSARTILRIFKGPTVTDNGTAITPANTYFGDSVPSSIVEAYKMPTVSDNGAILNMAIAAADSNSRGINRYYWVDPGHSVLVTIENSQSNTDSFADVYWIEGV